MARVNLIQPQRPARQSNLELLRVLLMLMIVAYHLRGYGGFGSVDAPRFNRGLLLLLTVGGKVAVDGFVLLSGYFMCVSAKTGLQPRRLLKLWMQIFFYSAGGLLVLAAAGFSTFSAENAVMFFLPVSQYVYWFATCYFFLVLLSPFLNMLARGLSRADYRRLLLVGTVLLAVVPTLLKVNYPVSSMVLFLYLYLLAGYVRLHPEPLFERKWLALGVAAGSYLFLWGYALAYAWLLPRLPWLRFFPKQSYSPGNSVPALLCALALLLFFKNLRIKGSRVVNLIASGTFGAYLLHEHSKRARELLWLKLFDSRPWLAGPPAALVWRVVWVTAAVFAAGVLIDLFRQYALEKPLFWLIDKTKFGKKYLHE